MDSGIKRFNSNGEENCERCENCRFLMLSAISVVECRVESPDEKGNWPAVKLHDWCGNYDMNRESELGKRAAAMMETRMNALDAAIRRGYGGQTQ